MQSSTGRPNSVSPIKQAVVRQTKARGGGWPSVAGAFFGFMFSYATLGVMLLSLLTQPLSEAHGWSRAEISFATMAFIVVAVSMSLPLATLMDRFGVRQVLLPSLTAFGLIMLSLCFLTGSLAQFYVSYVLLGAAAAATLPHGYTRAVVGWFDHRRGLALGVAATGAAVGMVALPPALTWVLLGYGWQAVYGVGAGMMLFVCLPIVYALLWEHPVRGARLTQSGIDVARTELRRTMQTQEFLVLALAFVLLGFGTIGLIPHLVPMLRDMQVDALSAAYALSLYGMAAVLGRLGCGILLDYFPTPLIAVVFAACPLVACVILAVRADLAAGLVAAVLIGIAAGAELDLMPYMISRYLGLAAFAQTYAAVFAGFYLAGGIGTGALGYLYEMSGNYTQGLWLMVLTVAIAMLLLGNSRLYRPRLPVVAVGPAVADTKENPI